MRLTLDLADDLVRSAQRLLEEEGVSLEELIEAGLGHELERLRDRGASSLPLLKDAALVPGVDLDDTSRLVEIGDLELIERNERRRHLDRHVVWTKEEATEFDESLRAQRPVDDDGDR